MTNTTSFSPRERILTARALRAEGRAEGARELALALMIQRWGKGPPAALRRALAACSDDARLQEAALRISAHPEPGKTERGKTELLAELLALLTAAPRARRRGRRGARR